MLIYIIYFIFIIVLSFILKDSKKGNSTFLLLAVGVMWLMIGFRPVNLGSDTLDYVQGFLGATSLDLKDVREPLYFIATYVIRLFTDNFSIYFLIIESGFCLSLYFLLKRYLNNPTESLIAVTLLFLLGIFAFSTAGLRQTVAIGFIILAFIAADNKKWWYYALCIALAYGFHNSSIIMAPLFILKKVNFQRFAPLLVVGMLLLAQLAPESVLNFLTSEDSLVSERFGNYGTVYESFQNYTGFFLQLIIVLIAHLRREKINMPDDTKNLFLNMAYLGLGFQSMTIIIAEFFRVSYYFCVFDIVLVPLALSTYTKNRQVINTVFMIGCLFYIFILAGYGVLPTYSK